MCSVVLLLYVLLMIDYLLAQMLMGSRSKLLSLHYENLKVASSSLLPAQLLAERVPGDVTVLAKLC